MAPRRRRSVSNVQNSQNPPPPPPRTFTPAANSQRQPGILPTVYQSNMKVLLRREPSITSIVDQFSHVCLYNHNGEKWEKHGYEGSMFLFEKSTQPPYGFFILNRMGTDDYVRPIYPEDDMGVTGDYLMCRFYPDFTKTRIDMGLPYPIPQEHRAAFDLELFKRLSPEEQIRDKDKEKKGRSTTLGLWMFATDAREPLKEVMMRLHSYVKQGLPYPDEFRYGPGRPPPPNSHLRTASRSSVHLAQDQAVVSHPALPVNMSASPSGLQTAAGAANAAGSELDKLFSKLLTPSPSMNGSAPTEPTPAKSIHELFAALGGNEMAANSAPPPPAPVPIADTPPTRGIALLDSIFASAIPAAPWSTALAQDASSPLPSHPEEIVIVSPKPTSTALPQILNQDVISTLLGLGPDSRASSAAPSSVGSHQSAQQRYEGDNEYSEGDLTSDGEISKPHAVRGATKGMPTIAVPQPPSPELATGAGGKTNGSRRVPGDVTPRPPAGGARLPPTSLSQLQQYTVTPGVSAKTNGNGAGASSPSPASASAPRTRQLVPFEANSDLWPYPRAPLDDRSFEQDDVVELDFTDTRALSDPAIFSSRLKEKKEKKEKGKKNRKEREKDKEREKAEIEKGWDLPTQTQVQAPYQASATGPVAEAAKVMNHPNATKSSEQVKKAAVNGTNGHTQNGALNGVAAKDAILSAMSTKFAAHSQADIGKNDFVRELLTLIHTDSQFVDNLWKNYLDRTA